MRSPDERLRSAIEAWRREEARERVWRWRGSAEALGAEAVIERHAWLAGEGARDALAEASRLGLVSAPERAAISAHLARAAEERELASARTLLRRSREARGEIDGRAFTLEALVREALATSERRRRAAIGRAIERIFDARLGELLESRARAEEARVSGSNGGAAGPGAGAWGPARSGGGLLILPPGLGGTADDATPAPPADPDEAPENLESLARELLDRTDGVVDELLRAGGSDEGSFLDLVASLASGEEASLVPRRDRWRRVASTVRALGLEEEVATRVRTEHHHGTLSPRAALAAVSVPTEIRIAGSPIELGALSELAAHDAFGRAVALALASPGLPVELRRPVRATVARAFGTLFAQLLAEPIYQRRALALEGSSAERLARRAATSLVLGARADAAAVLAHALGHTPGERVEAGRELLRRALGVPVPAFVAALASALPADPASRFRGTAAGLAAAVGLRHQFDEDWFRNPRTEEPLRAAAAQGGSLSAERWCEDELRISPRVAIDRLIEIGA